MFGTRCYTFEANDFSVHNVLSIVCSFSFEQVLQQVVQAAMVLLLLAVVGMNAAVFETCSSVVAGR